MSETSIKRLAALLSNRFDSHGATGGFCADLRSKSLLMEWGTMTAVAAIVESVINVLAEIDTTEKNINAVSQERTREAFPLPAVSRVPSGDSPDQSSDESQDIVQIAIPVDAAMQAVCVVTRSQMICVGVLVPVTASENTARSGQEAALPANSS